MEQERKIHILSRMRESELLLLNMLAEGELGGQVRRVLHRRRPGMVASPPPRSRREDHHSPTRVGGVTVA